MSAGEATGWTHSSDPQPVTQNGSGEASKRACSPARSRSPRSLTAASASAPTRSLGDDRADGHRERVVVERAGVAEPAARRVERAHQVGPAAERAERQPAAEVLAERRHVGRDAEQQLGAADAEARRHHLVEDQHRAVRRRQRPQRGEEVGVAGDAAAGPLHRLDEDARRSRPRAAANAASAAATSLYGSTT